MKSQSAVLRLTARHRSAVVCFFYPIDTLILCGCSGFRSCLGRGDSDGVGGNYVIGASLGDCKTTVFSIYRLAATNLPEKLPLREVKYSIVVLVW
jgi:hypothetical protein